MKKQKYNILILILVSLGVMYFVLKDDFFDIMDLITNIDIKWLLFSVGMMVLYWYFHTLCFEMLSISLGNTLDKRISFWVLFKSMIICNFFSAITPSATGGQPFQIYYLRKKGVDLGTATNLVVEQSTLYQVALVLMGLVIIVLNYFFNFLPSDNILKNLVLVGFGVNVTVIAILSYISFGKKSNKFIVLKFIHFLHKIKLIRDVDKAINKVEQVIDNFYMSAKALNSNKSALIKGIIYNFIGIAFLYLVPLTVAYSLGDFTSLNIANTIVLTTYVMLIGVFVPVPGGAGGVEFAFITFFGMYMKGSALMALLLMWRFITYYLTILVGGLVLVTDKVGGK